MANVSLKELLKCKILENYVVLQIPEQVYSSQVKLEAEIQSWNYKLDTIFRQSMAIGQVHQLWHTANKTAMTQLRAGIPGTDPLAVRT